MHSMLDAWSIVRFQDRELARPGWPQPPQAELAAAWEPISADHRCNCLLWQEEDRTRRRDVLATDIAASKRQIDSHKQLRNDAVEHADEAILTELAHVRLRGGARLSSETAGSMIDRLSVLALKIHHMRLQSRRVHVGQEHAQLCGAKLERLEAQRSDLAGCLDRLLREARAGETYFKVYRQFNMYDDTSRDPFPSESQGMRP